MRAWVIAIGLVSATAVAAEQPRAAIDLPTVLLRAGERVEHYFSRALSIVCLEVVNLQPLAPDGSSRGISRTVESELRWSWEPGVNGAPSTEAQTLRQLLRVNGHAPRNDDLENCTAPEQQSKEPHLLSIVLPGEQSKYRFTLAGETRLDRRATIMVDYRFVKDASVKSSLVEGREDCVSIDVDGGLRGRIWIDAESFDVLRLDQALTGLLEIPLPKDATRLPDRLPFWTMERWDTSVRFKRVSFTNPDETLVLPSTIYSVRITRGSATPRLRTTTDFKNYQRFLTSGRVVGD
jgi:hypothetical protein